VYRLIKAGKIPAVRVGRHGGFASGTSTPGSTASGRARRRATGGRGAGPSGQRQQCASRVPRRRRRRRASATCWRRTLALAEYDVDVAPDGRSALERCALYPYDLLIADLKMPDGRPSR
jgi:hypothetical protein